MAGRIHKVCVYLIIALGVIHIAVTPVFKKEFSPDAMYFASAGFAMIFIGLLNIALSRDGGKDRALATLCYVANALYTVFVIITLTVIHERSAYFVVALIIAMTVTAFVINRGAGGGLRPGHSQLAGRE